MGRRSHNTTKSGKYMNPTDQARKEARKKELKKNKKQRLMVRTAVLKNKDPAQILYEMDKLDEVEYNPTQAPGFVDKVLKEKRKKLRETFDRVMKLYQKEDAAMWNNYKQVESDYDKRRFQRIQYYEAVKQAEAQISVDDIPLPPPSLPGTFPLTSVVGSSTSGVIENIPLPGENNIFPEDHIHSILKNSQYGGKEPPGVPCENAPEYSDIEFDSGDEDFSEPAEKIVVEKPPKVSFEKKVKFTDASGSPGSDSPKDDDNDNDDQNQNQKANRSEETLTEMDRFMKEVEELSKMEESTGPAVGSELKPPGTEPMTRNPPPPLPPPVSALSKYHDDDDDSDDNDMDSLPPHLQRPPPSIQNLVSMPPPSMRPFLQHPPPPRMRFNVPPPLGNMRIPPPPSYLQQLVPQQQQRQQFNPSRGGGGFRPPRAPQSQFNPSSIKSDSKLVSSSMIEAKPQIRSLSADVTRFVPVSVKTKKEDDRPKAKKHDYRQVDPYRNMPPPQQQPFQKTKDDAYLEFMNEISKI